MLEKNFCSSPWFHIRINPSGNYRPCRWISFQKDRDVEYNIATTSLREYMNSQEMSSIRTQMLNGQSLDMCSWCHHEDTVGKVSGRKIQLLKSAINTNNFTKTFCSSPHYDLFEHSYNNQGSTDYWPVDFQIDLGNTCNGSCIICTPTYSSKLATDYIALRKIEPDLFEAFPNRRNWTDDPQLVEKFVNELGELSNIKYIHFLGGETLYLKSFYDICNRLIKTGMAEDVSFGTTTNCSVYNKEVEKIFKSFKHAHLGLSIEAFHPINDYVRWPSRIDEVRDHIMKFIALRDQVNLHLSLRITPNIFTVFHIDTIFEFMLENKIPAESCSVLREPKCLRVELLPPNIINKCLEKVNSIIKKYNLQPNSSEIINRRNNEVVDHVIIDTIFEYKKLFETIEFSSDVEHLRYDMVKFIKAFEAIRNNCILDYLPEYEEFLRSYGY